MNKSQSLDGSNISSEAKVTALFQMEKPVKDDSRPITKHASVKKVDRDYLKRKNIPIKDVSAVHLDQEKMTKSPNVLDEVSMAQISKSIKSESSQGFALKMPNQFIDRSIHTTTLSPNGTLSDTLKKAMQLTSSEDSSDHEVLLTKEELRELRLAYYAKSDDNPSKVKNVIKEDKDDTRSSSEVDSLRNSVKESRVVQIKTCYKKEEEPHYQVPKGPPRSVPTEFFLNRQLQYPKEGKTVSPLKPTSFNSVMDQPDHSTGNAVYEPIYSEVLPKALRNPQPTSSFNSESKKIIGLGNVSKEDKIKIDQFKTDMKPVKQSQNQIQKQDDTDVPGQPSYTNMEDAKAIMAIEGLKLSKNHSKHQKMPSDVPKRPDRQKAKKSVSLDLDIRVQPSHGEQRSVSGNKLSTNYPFISENRKLSMDNPLDSHDRAKIRAKTVTPLPYLDQSNQQKRAQTVTPQPQIQSKHYGLHQFTPIHTNRTSSPAENNTTTISNDNAKSRNEKAISKRWSNCSFSEPLVEEVSPSSSCSSLSYKTARMSANIYAEIPGRISLIVSPKSF